jgi:hypothetical protein
MGGEGEAVSDFPNLDESFDRLHRAGWSVGDIATGADWLVTGTDGENVIDARRGDTQAAPWWRACEQARAVGMLADTPVQSRR